MQISLYVIKQLFTLLDLLDTSVYDGNTINGYIEKLNIVEKAADSQSETDKEFARYEVALTFVEGTGI